MHISPALAGRTRGHGDGYPGFADRVADVARLLEAEEIEDEALRRLTGLGADLVPGGSAVTITIAVDHSALTFAASDQRLDQLHFLQFDAGDGPVVETLRHNEPRRIDDTPTERRWRALCRAAAEAGFRSLLALPLCTDRQPAGAIALYGARTRRVPRRRATVRGAGRHRRTQRQAVPDMPPDGRQPTGRT